MCPTNYHKRPYGQTIGQSAHTKPATGIIDSTHHHRIRQSRHCKHFAYPGYSSLEAFHFPFPPSSSATHIHPGLHPCDFPHSPSPFPSPSFFTFQLSPYSLSRSFYHFTLPLPHSHSYSYSYSSLFSYPPAPGFLFLPRCCFLLNSKFHMRRAAGPSKIFAFSPASSSP